MAAGEPRRSGRATKGQHKAHEDEPENVAAPKAKKGAKGKGRGKAKPVEEEEEEEEEEQDTIRCACGHNVDDQTIPDFIACDACQVWQHNICMGVAPNEHPAVPEHYFCEECRPEEHKELLQAIENKKQIWKDRHKEYNKWKKAKKTGEMKWLRKEAAAEDENTGTVEEAPPPTETGVKRKFEEEETSPVPEKEGTGKRRASTTPARHDKRRKSSAKPPNEPADADTAVVDIDALPKDRANIARVLLKPIQDGIAERVKDSSFTIPEGETAEALSQRTAQLIEYELWMVHGGTNEYTSRSRSILANFKKNPALLDRVLDKSLSPAELATMSTQDMASEELQQERQKMKEEADKQAVMVREEDDKPRVRRTHKGDEYVDDAGVNTSDSVFTSQPVRRRESEIDGDGPGSPTIQKAASPTISGPPPAATSAQPSEELRRQSSTNFDINNVWAKTAASPDTEKAGGHQFSPPPMPIVGSAVKIETEENKATGDADIDRLLADDDGDDSYSPADLKSSEDVVWKGRLIQPGSAELTVCARFVAGNDFSRFIPWQAFLPTQFEIEGRLERSKADEYLCGLRFSRRSDVSVLALTAYDTPLAFDEIFTYFHSRGRYAVGSKKNGCSELVKDLYISPVEKGAAAPPHIDLLDYCALQFPAPERVLLATFVINKPAAWDAGIPEPISTPLASHGRPSLPGPAASPINPSGPSFSPALHGSHGTNGTSASPFPPNPYAPQAPGTSEYPPHVANILSILGPYASSVVAQTILQGTQGAMSTNEAMNMRNIFDKDPSASESMEQFSAILNRNGGL